MDKTITYALYIATTPQKAWEALTNPDLTERYWGHRNISDWRVGSAWTHQRSDATHTIDISGTIVEYAAPERLVHTWALSGQTHHSRVAFDIEKVSDKVIKCTVTHSDIKDAAERTGTAAGWTKVLSSLKTFLETGEPLADLM